MKTTLAAFLALLLSLSCLAEPQTKVLPDCPKPKPMSTKKFVILQSLNFASTAFDATGSGYGATQCQHEAGAAQGTGPQYYLNENYWKQFRITLDRSLAVDGAVLGVSWLLHHKHHDKWAAILPITSAGVQTGIGLTQYSAGCF